MNEIKDKYLQGLSWNAAKESQDEAIEYFVKQFEAGELPDLFNTCSKDKWENIAIAITRVPPQKNNFEKLLQHMMDMNWPGAEIIRDYIVKHIDYFDLNIVRRVLDYAVKDDDEIWVENLQDLLNELETRG